MTVTQSDFVEAILDPAHDTPAGLVGPDGDRAGRRFDVYRNNVAVSLTEALETAFPVIAKLLGGENFKGLAGLFLRQHPPSSPLMMFYGAEMPDVLSALPQVKHLPYLADVARLELAMRHAYHSADAPVLAAEALSIPPAELMAAQLRLHPAARVVSSPWPIGSIWAYNMEPDAPKPEPGAQTVLVTRPEFDPIQTVLPAGSGPFLAALAAGQTFGSAIDAATEAVSDFDLSATLGSCLVAGAFTTLEA
jgi:hypothetical protein